MSILELVMISAIFAMATEACQPRGSHQFKINKDLVNWIHPDHLLFQSTELSRLGCARQCSNTPSCVSFTYPGSLNTPGTCRGHSTRDFSVSNAEPSDGASTFLMKEDIDECASSPCQNGGSCVDKVNACTCVCPPGYTGHNCQIDTDECASSPCQNGGSCVDQVNAYTCNCSAGYNGSNCETGNWLASTCSGTCAWYLTDCYSGFCLCRAGYYFSLSQYACVPACNELQDTYLRYINFDFLGHDAIFMIYDDVTECLSLCSSHSWCLGVVFASVYDWCYLKNATAQQYPQSWGENDICDMYQRTCA